VLEVLSSERPLLVTVEDLHWADPATLDVLRFASRVARVGKLLIVLSYRDDELDRGHPLRGLLADLDRNRRVDRIPLARLTPREVRAQAHDLMGAVPTADDARRLAERSQGIPFFVEELLALGAGAPVPASLREVLLARYDALPPSARSVCRTVAAAGERVAHPLLADVIELAEGELDVAVAAAVESGVLISDGAGYDFRHALVREAVGEQQLPGERVRTHTRYAGALADAKDDPADRTARAVRIAHHWYEALDLERAFETALSAMRMSLDSFAYATAAQLGERVLELWDRVPDPVSVAGQDLPTLMAATASAWRRAGEPSRALATVERALELLDGGDTVLRARLLRDKGMLLDSDARSSAVAELEAALELLPPGTARGLRAEILVELAAQYMVAGRGAKALEAAALAADEAPPEASRTRSFAANVRGATLLRPRCLRDRTG
jgi:predicted ATPase